MRIVPFPDDPGDDRVSGGPDAGNHLGPLLSAHLDRELDAPTRARVVAHLAHCGPCRRELAEVEMVRETLRRLAGAPGSPPAPGLTLAPPSSTGPRAASPTASQQAARHRRAWWGAAVAATVMGVVLVGEPLLPSPVDYPATPASAAPSGGGSPEPGFPEPGFPGPGSPEPGSPEPGSPEPGSTEPAPAVPAWARPEWSDTRRSGSDWSGAGPLVEPVRLFRPVDPAERSEAQLVAPGGTLPGSLHPTPGRGALPLLLDRLLRALRW